MLVTLTGREFFKTDDQIWAMHYSPARERNALPNDSFYIWYVAHGSGIFCFDSNYETQVLQGDIYLITPEKKHYFMSFTDSDYLPVELYVCKFKPNVLDGISCNCLNYYEIAKSFDFNPSLLDHLKSKQFIHLRDTSENLIRNLFIYLIDEYINRYPGYKNIMKAYLSELIIHILRTYEKLRLGKKSEIDVYGNPIVTNVIKYIQFNLEKDLTLDNISRQFYMSNSYLSTLFKKHTGVTIQDYVQSLRIDRVCDLLRNTDRTIEGIADRVRYNSNSYLHKLFKEKIGMTMREYRNKYRRR